MNFLSLSSLRARLPPARRQVLWLRTHIHSRCYCALIHQDLERETQKNQVQRLNCSSLNTEICDCIKNSEHKWALVLLKLSLKSCIKPNGFTLSLVIKACASLSSLPVLKQIHTHVFKTAFDHCIFVNTALIDGYGKCLVMEFSQKVFDEMCHRDTVAWNSLISGYSINGYLFHALDVFSNMLMEGVGPDSTTLACVLPCCWQMEAIMHGKCVHGYGIKAGMDSDSSVMNSVMAMYAKCGDIDDTMFVFDTMPHRSVVSWNTIIAAYCQCGESSHLFKIFRLFNQMHVNDMKPNSVTIISMLRAITHSDFMSHGLAIHAYAIKSGLMDNTHVCTSLVCMYAKRGNLECAISLYDSISEKNLVCLTALLACYVEKGYFELAMKHFFHMQQIDIKPDGITLISFLQPISSPNHLDFGLILHGFGIKSGFTSDIKVMNAILSMYSRCKNPEAAFSFFNEMPLKSPISWNTMIASYVQTGRPEKALSFFHQMKLAGHQPDSITMVELLSGCGDLGLLHFGKNLHNQILRSSFNIDKYLATALIDMYSKCGSIKSALTVFLNEKNRRSPAIWNAMIMACNSHGLENKALQLYKEMQSHGVKPDNITFVGVLSSFCHVDLVDDGLHALRFMTEDCGLTPGVQHYACIVDLLGRAGRLDEAVKFVKKMKEKPDSVVWGTLLGAACIHHNIKLGECVAKQLFLSDYRNNGFYVLMSNLYAAEGRWDDVANIRKVMRDVVGVDGSHGYSLLEVRNMSY
ncbi:pentatricopeptide repeat-containing protein At2g04860 [Amborella trichopoda]|uniref:pentatricopeptide repeat-containing protein At2g04860 n=1 Tax=Amborella trichopoda TaxID=13333 RepID=UPI0009BCFBFB|nr:pentatricopeptide repeat-containing protein At2g04860 [Amborella trichopoda]|eukprot:XP_011622699.2 pentatricopeptide repeat-containing protein At2g04860 [Amborella trichopoda]